MNKPLRSYLYLLFSFSVTLTATHVFADFETILAEECAKLSTYNSKGTELYKQKMYSEAREQFLLQAGWAESCDVPENTLATAYNNVALTFLREQQFLKAKAWMNLSPEDSKSVYNLSQNQAKIENAENKANQSITGEYWRYAGKTLWDSLEINQIGDNYQISFWGYRANFASMYYGPNMGEFEATLPIKNHKATYRMSDSSDNCEFDFEFSDGQVVVTQNGTYCGFGFGVYAGGTYIKVAE